MTPVVITLTQTLTLESLNEALSLAEGELAERSGAQGVVVDCLAMDSYTTEARARFVEWNRSTRERVSAVAVVTEKRTWHMIVATMAVVSSQRLKAFNDRESAMAWLDSVPPPET